MLAATGSTTNAAIPPGCGAKTASTEARSLYRAVSVMARERRRNAGRAGDAERRQAGSRGDEKESAWPW